MYRFLFCALFMVPLVAPSAGAQLSIGAHCARSCEQQNPDTEGAGFNLCLRQNCAEFFESAPAPQQPANAVPPPPPASLAASGAWSLVGFEERTAVVPAAQGQTSLSYECDGRGGHYVELNGVPTQDRIVGLMFDNGSPHYPTMSLQPTGFQIRLWKDHPLIQAIKSGNAVRVFERDGRLIGDYSLSNSSRAIAAAEANCGL